MSEQKAEKVIPLPVDCPACGAKAGMHCRTVIDGVDVKWNHDTRHDVYAGWRSVRASSSTPE